MSETPDNPYGRLTHDAFSSAMLFICHVFAWIGILFFILACGGCANKTPHVSNAEQEMQKRYETAIRNDDAIYEKTATANQINFERRKDLELKKDLQDLEIQSKLNPAIWTPDAILNERDRKKKLRDDAVESYRASQAKNDELRAKNRAINVGGARQIGNALNPPKGPPPPVDQTEVIEAAPKPVPLIQP